MRSSNRTQIVSGWHWYGYLREGHSLLLRVRRMGYCLSLHHTPIRYLFLGWLMLWEQGPIQTSASSFKPTSNNSKSRSWWDEYRIARLRLAGKHRQGQSVKAEAPPKPKTGEDRSCRISTTVCESGLGTWLGLTVRRSGSVLGVDTWQISWRNVPLYSYDWWQ
jgi:hypothetical protein